MAKINLIVLGEDGLPEGTRQIHRLPDYAVNSDGSTVYSRKTKGNKLTTGPWKVLPQRLSKQGYYVVCISDRPRTLKRITTKVHKLVFNTFFVGPIQPECKEVRHLNDMKVDNRITNLYPGTHKQNYGDAIANGVLCCGERRPNSILTDGIVREMRRLRAEGWSLKALAAKFDVKRARVAKVCRFAIWRHVS